MRFVYVFILFILTNISFSQKEANIWYFGNKAGLNFNSGSPVVLTDGAMTTLEGCASIADKFGNILFYTDGSNVYNKLHVTMPNGTGLLGYYHSTQSGIIVPKPGSTTIYYVFTVDYELGSNGLRYSIVDMTLDGGKGDVTTKNILLNANADEKVTAILHSNKKDIWVIGNAKTSNTYYAYLLSSSGLAPAVSSVAGSVRTSKAIGYLKASPDGKLLANAQYYQNIIDIVKFNGTTGIVSSWFNLPFTSAYGVEFSPDGKKIYATNLWDKDIYQYDMCSSNPVTIAASKFKVGTITGMTCSWSGGALQLGPDKKMYIAKCGAESLGCITNPNKLGLACGFVDNAVPLGGRPSQLGLPDFIQSYFGQTLTYTTSCKGLPTSFLIQDSLVSSSIVWDFGDPASGAANASSFYAPKHTYNLVGTYTVQAIITNSCSKDTLTDIITIIDKPNVHLRNDTSFCVGPILTLSVSGGYPNYLWNTGATTNAIAVSGGKYWVDVTNSCGSSSDTVNINLRYKPFVNLNDTAICVATSVNLSTSNTYTNYLWNTGATTHSITTSLPGKYWVKVTNECGFTTDTVLITTTDKPAFNLGNDTTLCNSSVGLNVNSVYPVTNYLWSTFATTSFITASSTGKYWARATNKCGSASDTIKVTILNKPIFNVNDTSVCAGVSFTANLSASNTYTNYLWNTGATTHSINTSLLGKYWVKVTNECGFTTDTIFITPTDKPVFNLGNDTVLCSSVLGLNINSAYPITNYLWNTGATTHSIVAFSTSKYWAQATNKCGSFSDTIQITQLNKPVINVGNDTSVCAGVSFSLNLFASNTYTNYLWNTGAITNSISTTVPGTFWVKATNDCGSMTDTLHITTTDKPVFNLGNDTILCSSSSLALKVKSLYNTSNYLWSTGSTASSITVSAAGKYWVNASNKCGSNSDTLVIKLLNKPSFNLGNDTSICNSININLKVNSSYSVTNYLWSNGSTGSSITVSGPGKYWVTATNQCGPISDTIVVKLLNKPVFSLGNDTTICSGTNINLKPLISYSVTGYLWSNGSTASSITAPGAGKYWATASNQCGSISDTLVIKIINKPSFVLNDTSVCDQGAVILKINDPTYPVTKYLWSNSSSSPSITVNNPGKYWLKITNVCGTFSDTSVVKMAYKPVVNLGNDTAACINTSTLSVKPVYLSYLWQDGSTNFFIRVTNVGEYWIQVTNECGIDSDTLQVSSADCSIIIPNVITINGDGVNDIFKIKNLQLGIGHLKIINRWGNPIFEVEGYNNDWSPTDISDGVYFYIFNYPVENKTYTGYITIFNAK